MKKITSLLLIFMLVTAILAGCGSSNSTGKTDEGSGNSATTTQEQSPKKLKVNEYGWAVPEKTLEFTYYHASKRNPDKEVEKLKIMNDYLLEKFNVKLNRIVYDADTNERLNLMLASNDYPEVIVGLNDSTLEKWKAQGKIQEMTPIIDKVGPNIKKSLGQYYKRYLDENGKLWGIPRGWGLLPIPDYSAHIRWDWYTAMGSPKIETPDDYYDVLKQMLVEHTKNANGEKVYAISWNDSCGVETVAGIWGLKDGYKEDADHNLIHWLNTAEGLEFTKYYNRFYREGMLDPDAFINKYEDWKTKFSNERIIGHIGGWWMSWNAGHEVWQKTMKDWKEEMRYVQIGFKAPAAEKAYLSPKDTYGWSNTCFTDKCKNGEDILKFIDFTMTPMGTRLMSWGVPNKPESVWNFDGNDKWSFNETQKQALVNGVFDYDKYYLMGGETYWFGVTQSPLPDDNKSVCWIDQNFNDENKWKKLMNENLKDTIYDNTARRVTFTPENPLTIVKQQMDDALMTGWAKAVLSKTPAECEANFNALRDKMNKIGLHDIEKFLTDEYKKKLDMWK